MSEADRRCVSMSRHNVGRCAQLYGHTHMERNSCPFLLPSQAHVYSGDTEMQCSFLADELMQTYGYEISGFIVKVGCAIIEMYN